MNTLMRTFRAVVKDWGVVELFLCVVLFPWSLLYVAMRICQEWRG